KTYALRLAAREGRRGAVQCEVAKTHPEHVIESAANLREDVTRNLASAPAQHQPGEEGTGVGHRQASEFRDGTVAPAHCKGNRVQPCALTTGAGLFLALVPGVPACFFTGLFGVEAWQTQACAIAARAPAVL